MDGLASCSVAVFRLCSAEYMADENLEVWIQKKENRAEKKITNEGNNMNIFRREKY